MRFLVYTLNYVLLFTGRKNPGLPKKNPGNVIFIPDDESYIFTISSIRSIGKGGNAIGLNATDISFSGLSSGAT